MGQPPARNMPVVVTVALCLGFALAACAADAPAATLTPEPQATPTTPEPQPTPTPEATTDADDDTYVDPDAHGDDHEEVTADVEVRVRTGDFDPRELTIPAGTTVAFHNTSNFSHTVTEGTGGQAAPGAIVDEPIGRDGTVIVTFDEPGTYEITCRIHPAMQMTVTVEG